MLTLFRNDLHEKENLYNATMKKLVLHNYSIYIVLVAVRKDLYRVVKLFKVKTVAERKKRLSTKSNQEVNIIIFIYI